jgi:alkylated DNA repair dioxygenase AlkB
VKNDADVGNAADTDSATAVPLKKLLHLPARSLLVLSGDARYGWQHGIAPRRSDRIDGQLVQRGRRVSLTFRQVC